MKKLKKKLSFIIAFTISILCLSNISSFAFVSGYADATEYTSAVTNNIVLSTQNDWYKITLSADNVPTAYTISLSIPETCVYNFDFRYLAENSTTDRPSVVSNKTYVTGSRKRQMTGVVTEPGTYYVRIYSQNGTTSSEETYRLSMSFNKNLTRSLNFGTDLPTGEVTDWCICADILGNYTFEEIIKNSATGRNYKNAYTFVSSNYVSDDESGYATTFKATPEQTAIAADYVFAGDLLANSEFAVETNTIYGIEELMHYLWALEQPIIFFLTSPTYPELDLFYKYVILKNVNIGENTITYYNPSSGNEETVDYDEFLTDGILYGNYPVLYSGTNILNTNTPAHTQAIFD